MSPIRLVFLLLCARTAAFVPLTGRPDSLWTVSVGSARGGAGAASSRGGASADHHSLSRRGARGLVSSVARGGGVAAAEADADEAVGSDAGAGADGGGADRVARDKPAWDPMLSLGGRPGGVSRDARRSSS